MIELVWDHRRQGTATASSGTSVTVGEGTNFSPSELLATAVASCLMQTFLQAAEEAGTPILSYAATAHVGPDRESAAAPRVHVCAYIVAPSGAVTRQILMLFERAIERSPIARLLGDRAVLTSDVRVLCDAEGKTP